MATEMFRSDAPWAMARTLIRERPSAENRRAATPGLPAMPSPTTASAAMSRVTVTSPTRPALSSRAKAFLSAERPASTCFSCTTQQIECSELPWGIITTETPA